MLSEAVLDDRQLAAVERIAALPVPAEPPCEEDYFLKCMKTLRLLPGRGDDDTNGELRLNLYRRHFGHYSRSAISFLTEQATLTCRWFPTPAECLDILKRWERTDVPYRAVARAQMMARNARQQRLDDLIWRLRAGTVEQAEVDALPERWRQIVATQGYIDEATHQLRPVHPPKEQTDDRA